LGGTDVKHKAFQLHSFKALDEGKGVFEAIVAVFNNVDRGGDKILPGAFKDTLAEWEAKGRPIPVIFSHEWANLDAHIGQVLEAKEVEQGLYIKGQLEMDEPFAQRVYKKMQKGTLAEFSFAYDVVDMAQVKEGDKWINELRKLELLEVGPCLVGMNPDTQLLGVKEWTPEEIVKLKAAWDTLNVGFRKEGRRNAGKDLERIQKIHDLCVELGAKCAEPSQTNDPDDEAGKNGKSSGRKGTFAERVSLELMEMGVN
jgi:HK97 family phage prohead protease